MGDDAKDDEWFWTPEWQAGERAADDDLREGRFRVASSAADLISGLADEGAVASARRLRDAEHDYFAQFYGGTGIVDWDADLTPEDIAHVEMLIERYGVRPVG